MDGWDRETVIVEIVLGIIAAILFTWLALTSDADAHEAPLGWKYPWSCCSNQDCKMMSDKAVTERPEGYLIAHTGEVVPYLDKRIKDSPDGEFHWCAHQQGIDAGHTICLFVPPKAF
jgi:hypothetical protein